MSREVALRWKAALTRRVALPLALATFGGLAGCRHEPVRVAAPVPKRSPVELLTIVEPDLPLLTPASRAPVAPPVAAKVDKEMRRWRKRPWPKLVVSAPPAPVPAGPPPAAAEPARLIGELSTGAASTNSREEAGNTIEQTDKRLAALPSGLRRSKRTQIAQIQTFQQKARTAINAGDTEGAMTLATKATLLLDDLLK